MANLSWLNKFNFMFPIVRLVGALSPREIPDGAGEAADPPHQGKLFDFDYKTS